MIHIGAPRDTPSFTLIEFDKSQIGLPPTGAVDVAYVMKM
jgi:hypothetical protein